MRLSIVKRTLLSLALAASGLLPAQLTPPPPTAPAPASLTDIKRDIQFESASKDELMRQVRQLTSTIDLLVRAPANDEAILKAFALGDAIDAHHQHCRDAQGRLASIAESIRPATARQLSLPEHQAYRQCQLSITEISNRLTAIANVLTRYRNGLSNYVQQMPPQSTMTLTCGLRLELMNTAKGSFYLSEPIPTALAASLGLTSAVPNHRFACLTQGQAKTLALKLSASERLSLTLPTQAQLELLPPLDWPKAPAAWSGDDFSLKNSLALTRRTQRGPGAAEPVTKLKLTPAQSRAAARFKMTFALVWDPDGRLGKETLTRELPNATSPDIATRLALPAAAGARLRLLRLEAQHRAANPTATTPQP